MKSSFIGKIFKQISKLNEIKENRFQIIREIFKLGGKGGCKLIPDYFMIPSEHMLMVREKGTRRIFSSHNDAALNVAIIARTFSVLSLSSTVSRARKKFKTRNL